MNEGYSLLRVGWSSRNRSIWRRLIIWLLGALPRECPVAHFGITKASVQCWKVSISVPNSASYSRCCRLKRIVDPINLREPISMINQVTWQLPHLALLSVFAFESEYYILMLEEQCLWWSHARASESFTCTESWHVCRPSSCPTGRQPRRQQRRWGIEFLLKKI